VLSIGLLYPPHQIGGYEVVSAGVTAAARTRGHDVRVLASDHRLPGIADREEHGVHRELRSYFDASARQPAPLTVAERLALERHNAIVLRRHLREFAPDVVSWWAMAGMSIALIERVRRSGIPALLMVHDTWPVYAVRSYGWTSIVSRLRLKRLAPLLEPLLGGVPMRIDLAAAGRYLFNSQYTRDAVEASGLRPLDGAVLTPGVSSRYRPAPSSQAWEGRLLYVGRVDPLKGVDLIMPAMAQLSGEASLKVVGSGPAAYEAELRQAVEALELQGRVELAGALDADSLPEAYASADAVLFPVRWEEPWGLVPLEAMAVGRPVIATAMGGAATYLRHERNALIVPPGDSDALAAAVRRLAAEPRLREQLRSGGLRTAAEHSAARYERRAVDELERAAGLPGG
jgi:glycosyltransferase involved in cell wall biosynthesis